MTSLNNYALNIVKNLKKANHKAYYAGGCVRDHFLNFEYNDIDIATSAKPAEVKKLFKRTVNVGEHFGVVIVLLGEMSFEVATFRQDISYLNGRHPERINFTDDKEDAKRRDFTINGMFFDPINKKIIDYIGGVEDLNAKIIRCIGNPFERFEEDKLRMLRAIRFATKLNFNIEKKSWQGICQFYNKIIQVSNERIKDELIKILLTNNIPRAIYLMDQSGLLKIILPELINLKKIKSKKIKKNLYDLTLNMLKYLKQAPIEVSFAVLLFYINENVSESVINKIYQRFKLSYRQKSLIISLLEQNKYFDEILQMKESQLKRFLRQDNFNLHLKLYEIYCFSIEKNLKLYHFCKNKLNELKIFLKPNKLLNGWDLQKLGLKPGPKFKMILEDVENAQLERKIKSLDEAIAYVKSHYLVKFN